MKIFISWSGKLSQELGNALKEWIPDVLQAVQCYFTPEDIQKGDRWSSEIAKELEESMFGIFCVTPENLNSGWMHFEAGAISKRKDGAQVCPILFGLRPTDLTGPLQQFQATVFSEEDMLKLMKAINAKLDTRPIAEDRLTRQFSLCWPGLRDNINSILSTQKKTPKKPARSERELLEEILTIVREGQRQEQNRIDRNSFIRIQRSLSLPLEKLTFTYIELAKGILEGSLDANHNLEMLNAMRQVLKGMIDFVPMSIQRKQEIQEQLSSLNFEKTLDLDLPF